MAFLVIVLNFYANSWGDKLVEKTDHFFKDENNADVFRNYRWPVFFGMITIIGFAVTQFPDTIIRRPHPIFWRVVLGLLLSYATFMTVVLSFRVTCLFFHTVMG
mgnify:CR=1 FL=1